MKEQKNSKSIKKLISFVLALAMIMTLFTVPAFADETEYVAKVGDTNCATVEDFETAFAACTGDVTVDLLANIDMGSKCLTLNSKQNITLNLNGNDLTTTGTQALDVKGGNLTVNDTADGKIIGKQRALIIRNQTTNEDEKSDIVINGGRFEGANYGVFASYGCDVTINGGQFVATATETENKPYSAFRVFCSGNFEINGGEFIGNNALWADYLQDVYDDEGEYVIRQDAANVYVKGGTFTGDIYYYRGNLEISDGNFSTNVNDYCKAGFRPKTMDDGRYVIKPYADADPIATIGEATYQTIQEAVNAAETGDTIKVLDDEKESITIPEDKDITLDLNGSSLSIAEGTTITNNGTVNLINSSYNEDEDEGTAYVKTGLTETDVVVENNGTMVLGNGIMLDGFTNIYNNGELESHASTSTGKYGIKMDKGSLTVKEGTIKGTRGGAIVNGGTLTVEGDGEDSYATISSYYSDGIDVYGEDAVVNVNGGFVEGDVAGIFASNCKEVNITSGTVWGDSGNGLVVKGGTVNVSGGTIYAAGEFNNTFVASGKGFIVTGDAIYAEANYGTKDDEAHNISINITDGTFISQNAYAVAARFTAETEHETPSIVIKGGQFSSDKDLDAIYAGANNEETDLDSSFDGDITVYAGIYSAKFDKSWVVEGKHFAYNTDDDTMFDFPYIITTALEGITFDQTSLTLKEGETQELTVTFAPEDATYKNVTWASSDESVATVEDGVVTAVSAGKTKIMAISGDKIAFCTVTVEASSIPGVKTIELDKTKVTYNGKVQVPEVNVTDTAGNTLELNKDYTVNYLGTFKNAGTYYVLVKFSGNYSGTKTLTFKIAKATQKLTVTKKTVKVKASKVKKAKVTVSAIKGKSNVSTTITYKVAKAGKNAKKYLKLNKKTGKITVKKGTPKGTYKLKIKVTAKKTANYKGTTTYKTVTIKVK